MHPAVKILVPFMALLVGGCFILAGLLRPALLWETGKLQFGRRMLGDGSMAAGLIVFGVVLVGLAALSYFRLRAR